MKFEFIKHMHYRTLNLPEVHMLIDLLVDIVLNVLADVALNVLVYLVIHLNPDLMADFKY